ncbi:MAG: DNA polymerase I [Clostridia bacterium]|nr:DNA polymerase I [Oscillospiraceae bacterium]MBQ3534555.1 DNA polymerase I [Clostridia bacterium]
MHLMVIDGNSLVNRAFYGVRPLTAADGTPTNAVYGFLNMLFKLREDFSPDEICVCFDLKAKTFRHKAYEGYKAQRKPMPEELAAQMPLVKAALDGLGICRMEVEGFEADDLLGTLSHLCAQQGGNATIVTGDRDSLQYITGASRVALVTTRMGQTTTELYDEVKFAEKYCGLTPDKIVDLKAIMGDSSDNIPGVKGIGEKGALDLVCRFGSLQGVYDNLETGEMTPSTRKKLAESRDMAFLSYDLAKGVLDAPVTARPGQLAPTAGDPAELYNLLSRLELRTIIKRLGLTPPADAPAVSAEFVEKSPRILRNSAELAEILPKLPSKALLVSQDRTLCAAVLTDGTPVVLCADEAGERAVEEFLAAALARPAVLHGAKGLLTQLYREGKTPADPAFDTKLGAYLLDVNRGSYDLVSAARQTLGLEALPPIYDGEDARNLLGVTEEAVAALSQHVQLIAAMRDAQEKALEQEGMLLLYRDMELPLLPVLARMQAEGICADKQRLQEFGTQLEGQIKDLEKQVHELAGRAFNIGSPKQLGTVLFEELGLKAGKKTRTGYSTDAETLEKLKDQHPIIPAILAWRKVSKLKSTYTDGLTKTIDPDGRIRSTFHQTVTATGRLSSADPNLQNLPVRREDGSEIRRCFTARPGWVLVDADYSQIELRVLAHVADDAAMQEAFASGEDFHAVTASQVFHVPLNEVTPKLRSAAKAVNFGIVYGISAWSLADDIKVSNAEAQAYIDAYLARYTGVKQYMDTVKADAEKNGFVTTLYGRKRTIPELKSSNFNLRSFGQRAAMNTPIQGAAADIIKLAMVRVDRRLRQEGLAARLILQVHDELIIEAPEQEREQVCILLKEEMEAAASLKVRLLADVSWGDNWYDAKK